RYAERQTMFVDRKILEFRVESQADEVERIFQRPALRDAFLHRGVERGNEVRGLSNALGNRLWRSKRLTAPRQNCVGLQFGEMVKRRQPIGEMGITAVARRFVLDEITAEYDPCIGNDRNHIAAGVSPSDMHDADFSSS